MTHKQVLAFCEALPQAEATYPFDETTRVYKIAGKIFILISEDRRPLAINVKVEPERGLELRARYPCVQPGYHMDKRYWVTATLEPDLPDDVVRQLITDSYQLIVAKLPRKIREALGLGT